MFKTGSALGVWLRFLAVMLGFTAAALLVYREPVIGPAFVPIQRATAQATLALVHILGEQGARFEAILYHPGGFGYEISHGCTGFLPAAFVLVGMLAYPASARSRMVGILIGVPFILALNLARLVHLFVVGVRWPAMFDLAHEVIWQAVMVVSVFLVWLGWVIWSERGHRGHAEGPAVQDMELDVGPLVSIPEGLALWEATQSRSRRLRAQWGADS